MTKTEALKLLEEYIVHVRAMTEHITAIKEALAQPEQEPVAKYTGEPYGYVWTSVKDGMEIRFTRMYPNEFYKPTDITPVYKTPKRTWVGLTDEDLAVCGDEDDVMLARYWERVCKEKNT